MNLRKQVYKNIMEYEGNNIEYLPILTVVKIKPYIYHYGNRVRKELGNCYGVIVNKNDYNCAPQTDAYSLHILNTDLSFHTQAWFERFEFDVISDKDEITSVLRKFKVNV